MITGKVRANEARVRLSLSGPAVQGEIIEAVIDTGFDGWLTLPLSVMERLGLALHSRAFGTLGDGSRIDFDVYEAAVLWDDRLRDIVVDEAEVTPLLGMRLLRGHELKIQVRQSGAVTIKPLRRNSRQTEADD